MSRVPLSPLSRKKKVVKTKTSNNNGKHVVIINKWSISSAVMLVLWMYMSMIKKHVMFLSPMERQLKDQRKLRAIEDQLGMIMTTANYANSANGPQQLPLPRRRLGILVGIFTADLPNNHAYRSRHRKLFTLWNDPRVCSLADFQKSTNSIITSSGSSTTTPATAHLLSSRCELIYTFVVGANPNAPPEWMEEDLEDDGRRPTNPILVDSLSPALVDSNFTASDLSKRDVTRLNIRENMNEGKSQTWFKFAYQIMEEYPDTISYTMKLDVDSILHLHEFFHFAYLHLPPPPYSNNAYVGSLRDKAYWPKKDNVNQQELAEIEGFFGAEFEGVHLYLAGQCYILSKNLALVVKKQARVLHKKLVNKNKTNMTYLEGHEDHDISAMIFHNPEPVHLITVGRKQRFWEHPVKGEPRWRHIWLREVARMEGRPFENKVYTRDSSYETVMAENLAAAASGTEILTD